VALLLHLAQAGPLTLTELAQHLARAPSTLSAKVAALEAQGLLARQPDAADGRKALLWLSPAGRAALDDARQPLDAARLQAAAVRLSDDQRASVVQALALLHGALQGPPGAPS
jgi:DNA-binding MarR family transcriptional regulator